MTNAPSRLFPALCGLVLLVFAWVQMYSTVNRSPAFNRTLQVVAATGGNRPVAVSSMYDQSEYLYQISYGAANSELLRLGNPDLELAFDPEDPAARWKLSEAAARDSLSLSPSNAYSWLILALADIALGRSDSALADLENAKQFAPNLWDIAFRRASLAAILFELEPEHAARVSALLTADFEILSVFQPEELEFLLEDFPALEVFTAFGETQNGTANVRPADSAE